MDWATGLIGAGILAVFITAILLLVRERPRWRHIRFGFFVERERFPDNDREEQDQ